MEPFDFHDNDTTEQIIPWRKPTTGVTILDPDHTVYQPLDGTVAMKAPRKPRGLMNKIIAGLFIFDVGLACYAIVALAHLNAPKTTGVVVGADPDPVGSLTVTTASTSTTTTLPKTTTVTTVPTTLKPATTQAAPKVSVCLP